MIRSRIAPTPSGYLHIGNALNFVLIWLWVHRNGGKLLLRIDDLDTPRAKPEYIEDIFRSLDWLGLDWDEGPQTPDELQRIYSQSLRADRYKAMTNELIATGRVFACVCSRKEMQIHTCTCRGKYIPLGQANIALHIITPSEPILVHDLKVATIPITLDHELKDFVIRRRDGMAAYQLASLADDLDYGINCIVRGQDLLTSTAAQLYLASLMGAKGFEEITFYHHPMVYDEQGRKLAKSSGSLSLKAMRESGISREQLYMRLSKMMGWKAIYTSATEMMEGNEPLF
jgi:glutamyl/glutaminyl-tRNA synthetase